MYDVLIQPNFNFILREDRSKRLVFPFPFNNKFIQAMLNSPNYRFNDVLKV